MLKFNTSAGASNKSVFVRGALAAALLAFGASANSMAIAADTIPLGLVTALTGTSAKTTGLPIANGARLAIERINAAGGVNGKQLSLKEYDDADTPDLAPTFEKAINTDNVVAIVGPTLSSQTDVAWSTSAVLGVPVIGSNIQAPGVTKNRRMSFRTMLTSIELMKGAIRGAVQETKPKTVMGVTQLDERFSYDTYLGSMPIFASLGVTALPANEFRAEINPVKVVDSIKATNPDVVFLALIARDATKVLLEMKKQKVSKTVVCNCAFLLGDVSPELKAASTNVFFSAPWSKDADDAFNLAFLDAYRAKYKTEPSSAAALAYESVYLTANALKGVTEAGVAAQVATVRVALSKNIASSKHQGVSGSFKFAKSGLGYEATRPGYVYVYRNGAADNVKFSWFSGLF
jgi:branched-chain amino acid transport system substrate-binding protein